jgi:KDO2-lipid IV(A) lauroyltransferase
LPTGIERLARSTGVPLLYASTRTLAPGRLEVRVESLAGSPEQAVDHAIQQLHADVRERPWAWWHWGLWEQMWHPAREEEKRDAH